MSDAPLPAPPPGRGRVAVVMKGYPRLSETFIAQELHALQERGQNQVIVSLRQPTDTRIHPIHRRIAAPRLYLPEYLRDAPMRVIRGWLFARHLPGYTRALSAFLADLRRDRTPNRMRRLGQACVLAREMPDDVGWLHCHYLHTPCSVTRYAALMRELPYSVSAHAKDIWTTPAWELREKLADARWAVTCTAVNQRYLATMAGAAADGAPKVELVYHGLDLSSFPAPEPRPRRTGGDPGDPVRLVSVGRAVEKKGYDTLLDALARLPAEVNWRLVHIGGGELLSALQERAARLGIGGRIDWRGPQDRAAVISAYRQADLFVLAARIAANGDRDGLPNVLMEAQATGLACVATDVSAIPELIVDGLTGLLVPPGDPSALAHAMARLIADPDRRVEMGRAGAARVRRDFAMTAGIDRLAERFGLDVDAGRARSV
ncbi:MAG: glycosyltransferase family 4 protein [Azospirillaceae bacterium]